MLRPRIVLLLGAALIALAAVYATGAIQLRRSGAQVDKVTGTEETLAEFLEREAALLGESLPLRTDEVTVWETVGAAGHELTFGYRLEVEIPAAQRTDFAETIRPEVYRTVCADHQVRAILDRGAVVVFVYEDANGAQAARLSMDEATCARE